MRYQLIALCLISSISALACSSSSTAVGPSQLLVGADKLPKDPVRAELSQVPEDCEFLLSSPAGSATASGGTFSTDITTTDGCEWRAFSNEAWIIVSDPGKQRNTSGRVTIAAAPNHGIARTGFVFVAEHIYVLSQSGASAIGTMPQPLPPAPAAQPPVLPAIQ
jgi:hypothetical protein